MRCWPSEHTLSLRTIRPRSSCASCVAGTTRRRHTIHRSYAMTSSARASHTTQQTARRLRRSSHTLPHDRMRRQRHVRRRRRRQHPRQWQLPHSILLRRRRCRRRLRRQRLHPRRLCRQKRRPLMHRVRQCHPRRRHRHRRSHLISSPPRRRWRHLRAKRRGVWPMAASRRRQSQLWHRRVW